MKAASIASSVLILASLSCRGTAEWSQTKIAEASNSGGSPIKTTLSLIEQREHEVRLELKITKFIATEKPLSVKLQLPGGVSAAETREIPSIDASAIGEFSREIKVLFETVPMNDMFVVADTQGTAFGFHAELPFRFGRPEPTIALPPRTDESVHMGNIDLGHPVLLPSTSPSQK